WVDTHARVSQRLYGMFTGLYEKKRNIYARVSQRLHVVSFSFDEANCLIYLVLDAFIINSLYIDSRWDQGHCHILPRPISIICHADTIEPSCVAHYEHRLVSEIFLIIIMPCLKKNCNSGEMWKIMHCTGFELTTKEMAITSLHPIAAKNAKLNLQASILDLLVYILRTIIKLEGEASLEDDTHNAKAENIIIEARSDDEEDDGILSPNNIKEYGDDGPCAKWLERS
ncbi:hypothetical protein ACJX0J_041888, partial [Zea mays]